MKLPVMDGSRFSAPVNTNERVVPWPEALTEYVPSRFDVMVRVGLSWSCPLAEDAVRLKSGDPTGIWPARAEELDRMLNATAARSR